MGDNKKQLTSGFVFTFLEKIGAQGVSFIVSIVLARLLLPSEYGLLAISLIFVQLCDVIVTYGFSNSLIVKRDSDNIDFSTCFYFSILISTLLYIAVWFSAPIIERFFNLTLLASVIRVLALRLPIVAVNSVQQAYVSKHMKFKLFFYGTLSGAIMSGIVGISLAYLGFGVWALVGQSLTNTIVNTLVLWILVKWRPIIAFSFRRLKFIYDYGWKILVTGLIDTFYSQLRDLVIGKKYSPSELAFYNRGMQFPTLGINIIEPSFSTVLFPALARVNNDPYIMLGLMRKMIQLASYIFFPFFILLACIAKPLILILLTEKWFASVIFLQLGCIAFLLRPIQVINTTLIRASGRSDLLLKLDVIKKLIGIILLVVSIPFGIIAIVWSFILTNYISTIINIYPNKKIYKYGFKNQLLDILPNLIISLLMGTIIWPIQYILCINNTVLLIFQVFSGMIIYIILSILFKNESYNYLKPFIFNIIQKRNKLDQNI